MTKMIHVRNVSDRMHRELMKRARKRGQTLDFIETLLERELSRPPADEVFDRVARHPPVKIRGGAGPRG